MTWLPDSTGFWVKAYIPDLTPKDPEPVVISGSDYEQAGNGLWVPPGFNQIPQPVATIDIEGIPLNVNALNEVAKNYILPQLVENVYDSGWIQPLNTTHYPSVRSQLKEMVPALETYVPTCPECGITSGTLVDCIVHLNDQEEWSREQIADWLETLDVDLTLQPMSQGD